MEWLLAFVRRAAKPLGLGIGTPNKMSSSISIDDAMAEASPFLRRMRLEGYDSAAVPFAEKHVQAWLRGPGVQMDTNTLINVLKVRLIECTPECHWAPSLPHTSRAITLSRARPSHGHCVRLKVNTLLIARFASSVSFVGTARRSVFQHVHFGELAYERNKRHKACSEKSVKRQCTPWLCKRWSKWR